MKTPRRNLSRRAGFTLVELLVTLSIIAIVAGITIPYASSSSKRGNLPTTLNNISAALDVARAIAMRDGKETAVVFCQQGKQDSDNISDAPYQLRILVKNDAVSTGLASNWGFHDYDDRVPDTLGRNVGIAGPDLSASDAWKTPAERFDLSDNTWRGDPGTVGSGGTSNKWLGVWFAADGTLKTIADADAAYNYFYDRGVDTAKNGDRDSDELHIRWVPFLAVFNVFDARQRDPSLTFDNWLAASLNDANTENRARIVAFSRYSGTLLK